MSLNSRLNAVRNYLASQHMLVDEDWLSGCLEYLTEDTSNNYTETDLKNLSKEQWLLNDLRDVCPGSLSANLKDHIKTVINGRHVVQINAAIDIGTPAYQQYLKLQNVNTENIDATVKFEDKVPSHRVIKLYLTDGVQEITAIEYKPMRNISCDITPGCKALLKGPIECRRGMLLLNEGCIELLGGEVQEMAVSNSLSSLLATKLGLPVTQVVEPNASISQPRNTNIPIPHSDVPSNVIQDYNLPFSRSPEPTLCLNPQLGRIPEPTFDQTCRPIARVTSVQVADNFVDDEIDFDELAAIEAQISENPGKRPLALENSKPEKKLKIDPAVNKPEDYPDDNDMFDEDEEYLKEMEAKFDANFLDFSTANKVCKGPQTVSCEPFVYIKQITELSENDKAGRVFNVKGQIMKLLSKLSVGKDGWSLRCTIIDGTGSINVEFTSDVLSKLVGFTPQEMNDLKRQMATKPELKEKAVLALQKAKDTLQVLFCIIEITILEVPKITRLTPFEESHVLLLKKRAQASAL